QESLADLACAVRKSQRRLHQGWHGPYGGAGRQEDPPHPADARRQIVMIENPITLHLRPEHFTQAPTVLATFGGLTATCFRYASGVAGLTIANDAGLIELLPFQGQQIWDAVFFGRRLTMGSMFDEPIPTQNYLSTYGAFFIHCGVTAMGNPAPEDTHPLHGELPNALYQEARLIIGEDADGPFMALTGTYRPRVAFTHNYVAEPVIKLGAKGGRIRAPLPIPNLKQN